MEAISDSQLIKDAEIFARDEIQPFAKQIDEKEELPGEIIKKLAEKGYLSATWSKEFMGRGLSDLEYGLITKEIGKACSSTRSVLTVQTSLVGETIAKFGSQEQKEEWLPQIAKGEKLGAFALTEPNVGTDAKSIQTTYIKSDNGYVLNGKKKWISFAEIADFFIIFAANESSISSFIVKKESEGIKVNPIKGLLGTKGTHIAEIELDKVFVEKNNILGREGNGFSMVANSALDSGRYSIAWGGVAIAEASLEIMVNYALERNQYGKKIYNHQLIKEMIANTATELSAANELCVKAAYLRINKSDEAVIAACIAKYYASKAAVMASNNAVQVLGGNGCYNKYPAERLFREAKILEIIEGTSQIQQLLISNYALRKYSRRNPTQQRK